MVTPQPSVFADRTIFVLGSRRSGTTWLAELLFAHPDVGGASARERTDIDDVIPSEPLIFGAAAQLWNNNYRPSRDGIATFMEPEAFVAALRAFSDRLFQAGSTRYSPGAPWYLEKSPDNVERLPILAATYPDAWNVHIVRDGRDVVRSLLRARTRFARRQRPHPRPGSRGRRGSWRHGVEGRWTLLPVAEPVADGDELAEAVAWQLLARWGVVFRDVYARERLAVSWREVLWALRRLEARGLIRGGHFVAGVSGEQFAEEAAMAMLRARRAA